MIGDALGRSKSTISRELKRNQAPPGQYWPDTAQSKTLERRKRGSLLDRDEQLRAFVLNQMQCHYWTPEQIAGHLKHNQKKLRSISHESIYAWIYQKPQVKEKLWKFLTRHKAKRGLRKSKGSGVSRIPNRTSIHDRPKVVDLKKEFGHWEADLMAFMKNSKHILVLRERKTMFTLSIKLNQKKAPEAAQAIINLMKDLPPESRKTITFDNGGEFAHHKDVCEALKLSSYFCDAYASWQKGGIENTNGRLRRDLPRNTNIQAMQKEDFDETLENYNSTPRKKLMWKTPLEAFTKNLNCVALHS